jgi:hypothetical protein
VFGREAQREAALESLRESPHALAAVVAEAGALTVQGVEKSFAGRKVVRA